MARISLRAYNRDIEVMIDKNQIDEAFAHCRYILELYPKHIDTYRLMGKALLEAQRFSDASDVFHRVLSSVPDDFIAHLGMSIIREDESNLDAAIWHMERSFEVQPSNAAVQVELRRLYGLRDGVTPQKIQLTRGALARMSAKSNLYTQAIAELRTALSNDPQRPDLQVVLAEMYLQTGARMEAIENCNSLINKLPYCQTANRILAEVLPDTERADQAQEYKTRSGELDPYYLQLSPVAPTLEQVPDGAVTIERFEYAGESFESSEQVQPSWAASLGVDLDDDEQSIPDESAHDWLQESSTEEDAVPSSEDAAPLEDLDAEGDEILPAEVEENEQIPDWMNGADESEQQEPSADQMDIPPAAAAAAGAAALGAILSGQEEEPEAELVPGEDLPDEADPELTPDWMSEVSQDVAEIAPEQADQLDEISADQEEIPPASAAGAAALGAVIAAGEDEESEPDLETEEVIPEDAAVEPIPDWMAAAGLDEDELIADEPAVIDETPPAPDEELSVAEDTVMASSDPEETQETPDWMSEAEPETEGEAPDWLREAMDSTDDEQEPLPGVAAGAAILSDDETPDTAAAIEEGAGEEIASELDAEPEPVGPLEAADEETEDDLPASVTAGAALTGAALAGAALGAVLDDDDAQIPDAGDEPGEPAEDGLVKESQEGEFIVAPDQEVPDWLQDLGEDLPVDDEPGQPVVFEDQPATDEPAPLPIIDPSFEDSGTEEVVETASEDAVELVPDEPAAALDEVMVESEFPESIPDWLSEVSPEDIPEQLVGADEDLDIVRAEIPIWLQKMEAQHKAELEAAGEIESIEELELDVEFTELSGEDVPSWLMSAMETELPEDIEEAADVEDISEIIHGPEQVAVSEAEILEEAAPAGLEAETEDELESLVEEVELAEMEAEPAVPEVAAEDLSEAGEIVAGEIAEVEGSEIAIPEPEYEAPQEPVEIAEEILQDEEIAEDDDDGISIPGLVAAGAIAAHILDDEDTQPVAVTDQPAAAEIEPEVFEEMPVLETEEEVIEIAEPLEAGLTEPEPELETEFPPEGEIEEVEPSPIPADAPLTGEDEDAAMAWLESLAAKQGAAEEELLTSTDERLEEPPEWVQEEALEAGAAEEEEIEVRDTALTAAALAGVTAGIIADDEEPMDEDQEAGLVAEEAIEEPSEWVPEIVSEEEQLPTAEAETVSEEVEFEPEEIEIEQEPDVVEELAAAAEVDLDQVEAEEQPTEEIPGWLSGLAEEQEVAAEAQIADWTPDMLAEEAPEPEILPEATPDEKLDLNAASLAQLERIPGIGFIHAQNIVNHRKSSGSFSDLDQLDKVEGLTPEIIADLKTYLTITVVTEVAATDFETPELQEAWNSVTEGDIDQAVDQYAELINQDQHLDEIIRDLQSALGKYPADSSLYQSLGDAYMRANMLQEALDSYNRAEDLI